MSKVDLEATSVYYEFNGKGKPLLLIAGLGTDVSSWALVAGKPGKNFQAMTMDNRGF